MTPTTLSREALIAYEAGKLVSGLRERVANGTIAREWADVATIVEGLLSLQSPAETLPTCGTCERTIVLNNTALLCQWSRKCVPPDGHCHNHAPVDTPKESR